MRKNTRLLRATPQNGQHWTMRVRTGPVPCTKPGSCGGQFFLRRQQDVQGDKRFVQACLKTGVASFAQQRVTEIQLDAFDHALDGRAPLHHGLETFAHGRVFWAHMG